MEHLKHPEIKSLRGKGLLYAMELENEEKVKDVIKKSLSKGVITDWFLFCDKALRIAPPLNINKTVLKESCDVIVSCL